MTPIFNSIRSAARWASDHPQDAVGLTVSLAFAGCLFGSPVFVGATMCFLFKSIPPRPLAQVNPPPGEIEARIRPIAAAALHPTASAA